MDQEDVLIIKNVEELKDSSQENSEDDTTTPRTSHQINQNASKQPSTNLDQDSSKLGIFNLNDLCR